jgi:HlyD family secretion protein
VLAELDQTSLAQTIVLAQSDLITAQRNLDTLKSSELAKTQAQQMLANAQKAAKDAKTARDNLSYTRGQNGNIDAAYAELYLAQDALKKAQDRFNTLAERDPSDPARASAQTALVTAQQKVQSKQSIVNWYLDIPSDIDLAQADANLAVAVAQLNDAQREWNRLKNGPDPNDLKSAENRIAAIQSTLALPFIKAPFNGTISDALSMVGDQVGPSTTAFRIDDTSRMLVDVLIPEVDINRIKVGQPVRLNFDAIQGKDFNGKVTNIARFGTTVSGAVNFGVTIELTDQSGEIRPGMTAAVNVVVEQLDDVLLVPNRAVRLKGGQRVVYVMRDGVSTAVNLTIGSISDSDSQILSGDVKEGDLIVLNPPVEFNLSQPPSGSFAR